MIAVVREQRAHPALRLVDASRVRRRSSEASRPARVPVAAVRVAARGLRASAHDRRRTGSAREHEHCARASAPRRSPRPSERRRLRRSLRAHARGLRAAGGRGPLGQREIDWYGAHPAYLDRTFDRGRRYLHHIVQTARSAEHAARAGAAARRRERLRSFRTLARLRVRALAVHPEHRPTLRPRTELVARRAARRVSRRRAPRSTTWRSSTRSSTATGCSRSPPTTPARGACRRAVERNERSGRPTDFFHLDLPRRDPRLRAEAARDRAPGGRPQSASASSSRQSRTRPTSRAWSSRTRSTSD